MTVLVTRGGNQWSKRRNNGAGVSSGRCKDVDNYRGGGGGCTNGDGAVMVVAAVAAMVVAAYGIYKGSW